MNYDINKETIFVNALVFDGCQEIPVDLDFSLPDYCPDIQKILKCNVSPKITSRNISGDRLNIEGSVNIKIIYLDADKKFVRCCENSAPFSCSIDLRTLPENSVAITSGRVEYMNCRAVSPRKIDIHGALAICAKVYNKNSQDISECINGEDVQQKKSCILVGSLEGIGQQQFGLSEMLDLGQSKTVPELIIRSDVSLLVNEYRSMINKVAIKGEALVKILYMGDLGSGQLEVMEYSIPFSQVIDVPGASESSKCTVTIEILSHDEEIQGEGNTESNLISEDIRAAASVMAYNEKEVNVVTDAYSMDYDMECSNEFIKLFRLSDTIKDLFSTKSSIEFTEFQISRVIDIWSDSCSISSRFENGKIICEGRMNICVLAIDLEETPFYIERIIDVSYKKDLGSSVCDAKTESSICPVSIGYRITGSGSIEIKADIKISIDTYMCEKCSMTVNASASESEPKTKDTSAALTIYYAGCGESIWDIARKYYTCAESIKNENDISSDTIEQDRMLLIPMK